MLIELYKELLEKVGYLPLEESDKWRKVQINHTVEYTPVGRVSKVRTFIRNNVISNGGIYIYVSSQGEIMYIGEGGNVQNRVIAHYNESHMECKTPRFQKWYDFFGSYREVVDVWVCEVNNYYDRIAIETMLTRVLRPVYIGE